MIKLDTNTLSFDWDEGNTNKNKISHNIDNFESEEVFFGRPLVLDDPAHSRGEVRKWALGVTGEGGLLHVTFTYRNNRIRIISARNMSKKERMLYEEFKKIAKI